MPRLRNVEQRVALRRHFAQAAADQQHQIGALDAREQFRIGRRCRDRRRSRDAARRTDVRGGRWWRPAVRSARQSAASAAQAASDQRLPPSDARSAASRRASSACSRRISVGPGQVSTGSNGARVRHRRRARAACLPAARSPPVPAGRCRRCETRARRSPECARDRRFRSPISPSCRTRRDSRVPGTPRARACRAPTWPTNMIIGDESCRAMWMPAEALVAPGPRVTKQMPGRPVDLADRLGHHRRARSPGGRR